MEVLCDHDLVSIDDNVLWVRVEKSRKKNLMSFLFNYFNTLLQPGCNQILNIGETFK